MQIIAGNRTLFIFLPSLFDSSVTANGLKKGLNILDTPQFRINDLLGAFGSGDDNKEIGGSRLPQALVNLKVVVRKKRKGDLVFFSENIHLKRGVACPDADDLYFSLQLWILLHAVIEIVYVGRLPLAIGAVHAENLNNDRFGLDLMDLEKPFALEAQVSAVGSACGNRECKIRQDAVFLGCLGFRPQGILYCKKDHDTKERDTDRFFHLHFSFQEKKKGYPTEYPFSLSL